MNRDVCEFDLGHRSIFVIHGHTLNSIQCRVCPIYYLAKDGVLPVEMRLLCISNKELRLVRIRTGVGHRYNAA